jgi:hypothetical protein
MRDSCLEGKSETTTEYPSDASSELGEYSHHSLGN